MNVSGNFHEGFHIRAGAQQPTEGLHQNPSGLQTEEGRGGGRDAVQCLRMAGLGSVFPAAEALQGMNDNTVKVHCPLFHRE